MGRRLCCCWVDAARGADAADPVRSRAKRRLAPRAWKPIVVVNKIDRPGARPGFRRGMRTFDLFDKLGASEDQAWDFPGRVRLGP